MYMLLAKEIADVDSSCFEKLGMISQKVLVVPNVDQAIALKGTATHGSDDVVDCQNTLFLHWSPLVINALGDPDFSNALEPGALYYYRGDKDRYKGHYFVELRYEHELGGAATLIAYFLVNVNDCEFAVVGGGEFDVFIPITFMELVKQDYFTRVEK